MDPSRFQAPEYGAARREPGNRWAFWYFLPEQMPRQVPMDAATVYALSEADAALGQLRGLGQLVKDPELLVGPYLTREALASSRIEGTEASLSDVLQAEASGGETRDEDVKEVERYIAATRRGVELIRQLPITNRLVCDLHAVLMRGVRGEDPLPGQFRRSPVWVGSPTDSPETATYVPPLQAHVPDLLADWERFVNQAVDLPVLIRAALMHYQFETIHPFLDGNGRIGRLLIGLLLIETGRMPTPLLYLSGYLETHRPEYYDRLQAVRERGEIQQWLQFFLTAVKRQAQDACARATQLVDLREHYLAESITTRSRLPSLVNLVFANPYVNVLRIQRATGLTNQAARNLAHEALKRGWLTQIGNIGRGGRTWWIAQDVLVVMEAPAAYDNKGTEGQQSEP